MPGATCCADHVHCCPSNLPICDVDSGRCLPPSGAAAAGGPQPVPWATKLPARRQVPASGAGFTQKGPRARFVRPEDGAPMAS